MDREELATWVGEGSQGLPGIRGDTGGVELWWPPWRRALALKSLCLLQFPATRTGGVWKPLSAFLLPSSLLFALPLNLLFSGPVCNFKKTETPKRTKTSKIPNSKDICFHIFVLREKKDCRSRIWFSQSQSDFLLSLLEKGRLLTGEKKKKANRKPSDFKGLPQNLDQTAKDEVLVVFFLWWKSCCHKRVCLTRNHV